MNKVKIGVIGAGWWATENHIPHLAERKEVELTSVCKLEEDQLNFVKNKFGFKFASTNYREMLQLSKLDGVIISSPHHAHFENAKAALEKNCHVMIEKPMTTVSREAETLLQLAKKKNKHILIPNGFNFKNFMSKAEEIIINKKIGEIKHVDAAFSSSLTDLFQGIPLSESNNHTFQPHASTWSDPNKGGGYGWGQLSHMFAGVLKITHLEPDQVFCLSVPSPTNVDYTNAVSMKFSNGATGSFSGSAFVPKDFGGTFYITVHGTLGVLYLDMELKRERLFVRLNNGETINYDIEEGSGTFSYGTKEALNTFVDLCLDKDVKNHSDGELAVKTVRILEAMYKSIENKNLQKI